MKYWKYIRTACFLFVGLMNTVFIKPEDAGTISNYIGYLLLVLGVIDLGVILFQLRKKATV